MTTITRLAMRGWRLVPGWVAVALALCGLAALPVRAATQNWIGNSGTWDDTTTGNWDGGAVPANGDTANLTQSSASDLSIGYTATNLTGSGLALLTIGNAGGGTNTLTLDGTDSLPTQKMNVNAGGAINQTGGAITNSLNDGSFNFVNTGGTYLMGGGTWRQSGGSVGSRGTINQTNGAVSMSQHLVVVNDSWTISGGTLGTGQDLMVGLPWGVSPPTAATPTLNIDGGTVTVGRIYAVGGAVNNSTGVVNQTAGTVNVVSYLNLNARGIYNLSGGTLNSKQIPTMVAGTVFNHTDGEHYAVNGSTIGATYNFSGGNWKLDNFINVSGTVNWTGGTLGSSGVANQTYAVYLNASGAVWNMQGTTLTVNRWANAGVNSLRMVQGATLQGYGTVQDSRYGVSSPGTFQASGRVIANGYGAEQTLDASRWNNGYLTNPTDNTGSNGWFTVSKGKLLLPDVTVAAGASTQNWGEASADTTIDLVNSARLAFTGASGGTLSGALFANDRTDVPADLYKPVGVWSFGGVACSSATLTFRYDAAAAAALGVDEADLRVWRHNGATWDDVTDTRDAGAKTITSQAVGSLASTTFFAVSPTQPASEPPVIEYRPVSNVATNGATFNAYLATNGALSATVYALWGETDESASGAWANTNEWSAGAWPDNSYPATNMSLSADQTYYYTFGARDAVTNVVADSRVDLITGALNVEATDPTGRVTAVDTITFTVSRPAGCTDEDLVVNYALGGTATNVTDYTIAPVSGAVAIAQGQVSGTIVVTPVWKNGAEQTVILTLTPGAYAIGSADSATGALAEVAQTPTTRTWDTGSGTWDDVTPGNWDPSGVPFNGDIVNLTPSSAALVDIDYTSVGLTSNGLEHLVIGNSGGGTNALSLDSGELLPTGRFTLDPGGAVNMTGGTLGSPVVAYTAGSAAQLNGGTFTLTGGLWRVRVNNSSLLVGHAGATGPATLNILGTGELNVSAAGGGGQYDVRIGGSAAYPAVLDQSGGSISSCFYLRVYDRGTYRLSSGTLAAGRPIEVSAGGTYAQSGGTASCNYGIGVSGGGSLFNLSGGSITPAGDFTLGANGSVNWTGGTFSGAIPRLTLNGPAATWTMQGGTLGLNNGNPAYGLFNNAGGTVQGYGRIQDNYAGGSGAGKLDNSGRVIADGFGAEQTLDLSGFRNQTPSVSQLYNTTDNTTNNGWYAEGRGKLELPAVTVADGSSTQNWGEASADTVIDLVNSARLAFTGATAGSLSGSILSTGRTDVAYGPPHNSAFISIHEFAYTTSPGSVTVTIRYDDAAVQALELAEDDIKLWHDNGAKWVEVTDSVDTVNKRITGSAVGTLGQFAVTATLPPAGTVFTIR